MVDIISNLWVSILSHILSFLRTKEATITSILSSRWKPLWTLVPNLDLDDYKFPWISYPSDEEQSAESPDRDQDQASFENVVSRILVLRKSNPLKNFNSTGILNVTQFIWIDGYAPRFHMTWKSSIFIFVLTNLSSCPLHCLVMLKH